MNTTANEFLKVLESKLSLDNDPYENALLRELIEELNALIVKEQYEQKTNPASLP